jgi:hypothetical protein
MDATAPPLDPDFDTFLESAWNDHADQPQAVAERLAGAWPMITTSTHIAPFARIVAHVYGEHLGRWDEGIRLLERLRGHRCRDGDPSTESAISRNIAALRYAADADTSLAPLSSEDRVTILAMASAALAGQRAYRRAIAAYDAAIALAGEGLADGSPGVRALAVGGNNLAASLEEKVDRDAFETSGMVAAAEGGLKYWKRAGSWLEEERAEYRLACSLIAAGDGRGAISHAARCVEICTAHAAAPFELFFGFAALALAQRAAESDAFGATRDRALELYEQVADDEKQWCAQDLAALRG